MLTSKLYIVLFLLIGGNIFSQILPLEVNERYKVSSYPEFGSGFIYSFGEEPAPVHISDICVLDYHTILFQEGESAYQKGDVEEAIRLFKDVISIPISYKDTTKRYGEGYRIVKLKSKSCEYLKNIYFSEKKYNISLYYHKIQNTSYSDISPTCFWGVIEQYSKRDRFAIACYEALENYDEAIKLILWYWGLPGYYNSEVVMANLLMKKYGDETLKAVINNIIQSKEINFADGTFSINIYGLNLPLSWYRYKYIKIETYENNYGKRKERVEPTEQEIYEEKIKTLENFKNSKFYKLIMEN